MNLDLLKVLFEARLSVQIFTDTKHTVLTFRDNGGHDHEMRLSDIETELLGIALLKCHARFNGFQSVTMTYSKEDK